MCHKLKTKKGLQPSRPSIGAIKFNNVSFQYDQRSIPKQVSFDVPAGKKIAVVGDSGAGKSTSIIKLLFRAL
ncbi:ATP-binding cassette domain-containing protein [Paucibacter sp. O1-1]|nr:ATP-binding cassette domain-containing protein [Paucibacter sp. O1-1]MDA3831073.1 ATP-binding cassette domain-containing protein [Paucibacter sp. O1-1]